ncbi:MAG: Holliday junction branch migration protein RuvA [Candidatus Pacebacteria bacterium]|nr:Holliday junction branch migration protein RuvA [Candidatus Paceibacterota bacterium]
MIGYLKGKIQIKGKDYVVVNVNGVGYKLFVSNNVIKTKKQDNMETEFFVWPHLKRETIELYGCSTQQEFETFQALEKLRGIGPKTALCLAGFGSLEKIKKAIEAEDKEFLSMTKGIGKKRLQRLGLELTGKIKIINKQDETEEGEDVEALISLGFTKKHAKDVLSKIPKNIIGVEERVKQALTGP